MELKEKTTGGKLDPMATFHKALLDFLVVWAPREEPMSEWGAAVGKLLEAHAASVKAVEALDYASLMNPVTRSEKASSGRY